MGSKADDLFSASTSLDLCLATFSYYCTCTTHILFMGKGFSSVIVLISDAKCSKMIYVFWGVSAFEYKNDTFL